ncbi:MAG: hypothetical protein KJ737_05500 [Proteobacteria bacterium]|nr:hypothetical protein [Pseudomonadota bacterium]
MNDETIDYTHPKLNETVVAIGGNYILTHEKRLNVNGRDVLYYRGVAVFDTTCCGAGGCSYAYVPGFIVEWKKEKTKENLDVSRIAPVKKDDDRKSIESGIMKMEMVYQVNFL